MIKANELRVGNWIASQYDDDPIKVTGGLINAIENGMDECSVEGIPITPEILGKAGFSYHSYKNGHLYYINNSSGFTLLQSYGKLNFSYSQSQTYGKALTYVHQLQNLYFALTGEELNIQL
jgi:hypothetical protein